MSAIIAQNKQETGEDYIDGPRIEARKTLDNYLAQPLSDPDDEKNPQDTFQFWKNYSVTTDKAQKSLCGLARRFLTPPPTSTGISIINLNNMNGLCEQFFAHRAHYFINAVLTLWALCPQCHKLSQS